MLPRKGFAIVQEAELMERQDTELGEFLLELRKMPNHYIVIGAKFMSIYASDENGCLWWVRGGPDMSDIPGLERVEVVGQRKKPLKCRTD